MSLRACPIGPVPEKTARVARAAFAHRRPIEPAANRHQAGLSRRALVRRGALLVGSAALASLLDACAVAPSGSTVAPAVSSGAATTRLVILGGANTDAPDVAPRKQVVPEFMANNPDVTMDWRALPSNIQWDRVARTAVLAGEPVDLLNINRQFIRAWVRDNLLKDLSQLTQLTSAFANVDPSFLGDTRA